MGKNTEDHWNDKHINEYGVNEPYDYSQIDRSPLSYHKVAYDIIVENRYELENKSILEIGCAVGYFSSYMATKLPEWKIEGWDFSKSGIFDAREKNKNLSNVEFRIVDFLQNPVKNDYGIICLFEVLEHTEEKINYKLLNQWLEHCEYLIISVPTTKDDCRGEHISHYEFSSFEKKGYQVEWKARLGKIDMSNVGDFGDYFHFIALLRGKL